MSDSLPALFSCFIRLEMLNWLPLYNYNLAFDKFHWYGLLEQYGKDVHEKNNDSDPDLDLVPKVIQKVILPMVSYQISQLILKINLIKYVKN